MTKSFALKSQSTPKENTMTKRNKSQEIIVHEFNGIKFYQRASDGYCDANTMCKANDKRLDFYLRNKNTKSFLKELQKELSILPTFVGSLIDTKEGKGGGTFVHPLVANHLASWCSPEFAVKVALMIEAWKQGRLEYKPKPIKPEQTPEYLKIRQEGKETRKDLTHYLIKECGKKAVHVMNITDQIYRGLFGMDSKALRRAKGLDENSIVREHLTFQELFYVKMMEDKAVDLLEQEKAKGAIVSSGLVGRVLKELGHQIRMQLEFFKRATVQVIA